ncbi:MAG: peptide chain release factor N(5)-glutamine methyltransferase, partial [Chloroflexota bacterium]
MSTDAPALSIQTALSQAQIPLLKYSDTAAQDAQVLLAHICAQTRTWVITHPEYRLSLREETSFEDGLADLENNVPLPYILGEWEFYGLKFKLTPDVLIPRPETELLVETTLAWLKEHPSAKKMADIGTGSGCIPVSLAKYHAILTITAIDISAEALKVAETNAQLNEVNRQISFTKHDLLSGIEEQFDIITANLPYIPTETLQQLDVYGREPTLALDGGDDGLDLIKRLLTQAPACLSPG